MHTKTYYEQLKEQVHLHNYRYHVLDAPLISDLEYDRLLNERKAIEAEPPNWVTPDSHTQRAGVVQFAEITSREKHVTASNRP